MQSFVESLENRVLCSATPLRHGLDTNTLAVQAFTPAGGPTTVRLLVYQWTRELRALTPDGEIDWTFGSGGFADPPEVQPGIPMSVSAMKTLPNGKILLLGGDAATSLLARLHPDGRVDRTFGTNGILRTPLPRAGLRSGLDHLAVSPTGAIVAAGTGTKGMLVARFKPNGPLDTTFGKRGFAVVAAKSVTDLQALAADAAGNVTAFGWSGPGQRLSVLRVRANGTLDTLGTPIPPIAPLVRNNTILTGAVAASDGSYFVAGTRYRTGALDRPRDMIVGRILPTGHIDKRFGTSGWSVVPIASQKTGFQSLALDERENLLLASLSTDPTQPVISRLKSPTSGQPRPTPPTAEN